MRQVEDQHGDTGHEQRAPAAEPGGQPHHDHEPERDGGELGDLRRRRGPECTAEPAPAQGPGRRDDETEKREAEHDRRRDDVAPDQEQVPAAPPRGQQPEREDEPAEAEAPVYRAEVPGLKAVDERLRRRAG